MDKKSVGVIAILICALLWSIEPILIRWSTSNSDVLHTLAIRTFVVTIIAGTYLSFSGKSEFKATKKQVSALVYLAIAATLFGEFLYLYAIGKTSVVNAVLIAHTQPIFIAMMGYIFLKKEKLTSHDYIGMALMIIAGLLVTTKNLQNLSELRIGTFGDLLVLISSIIWASTSIVMKRFLNDLNPSAIVFYRYGFASVALLGYLAINKSLYISNIYQIFLGILIGVGMIIYYEGMKRIKAAQVGALELASPFFAAILGFLFFSEMLTLMQVIGMAILLLGIYFLGKKEG